LTTGLLPVAALLFGSSAARLERRPDIEFPTPHRRTVSGLGSAVRRALLGTAALLVGFPAQAVEPWIDREFDTVTPAPDVDLVVVRERAFESVDLSALGLGPRDYVQSIYFRLYAGPGSGGASFTGTVSFPEGVEILQIVTSGGALGGEPDDGMMLGMDGIFGIDVDPDDYSAEFRGFEEGGRRGSSEFVLGPVERSFAFALNVTVGVDDFRVIVDYGDSFPADLAFDLGPYDVGEVGGLVSSPGIRVGSSRALVLGSGDFGEVRRLSRIPLTSNDEPEPGVEEDSDSKSAESAESESAPAPS
jgi:hypothetical protein